MKPGIWIVSVVLILFSTQIPAQVLKKITFDQSSELPKNPRILRKNKDWSQGLGLRSDQNPGLSQSVLKLGPSKLMEALGKIRLVDRDTAGYPIRFETEMKALPRSVKERDLAISDFLKVNLGLTTESALAYKVVKEEQDELGVLHLQCQQTWNGIDVLDGEYLLHVYPDQKVYTHGKIQLPDASQAFTRIGNLNLVPIVQKFFKERSIAMTSADKRVGENGIYEEREFLWRNPADQSWIMIHLLGVQANPYENWELYVDVVKGTVVKSIRKICGLRHHHEAESCSISCSPQDAETATGRDLLDVNRAFGVWREGSTYYLMDAGKPMFNRSASRMPQEPVGVILTLDAQNTSPTRSNFRTNFITSSNNTWSSKAAVSAHFNANLAYQYYLNTFSRNSISGNGDNIVSVINVTEDNGQAMDNAFWNGKAMFYGNGNRAFTSLAKAVDVAGHELTHGVIQNTANLVYEDEPGAINESFADIFGVLIDRDDWLIGEEIVVRSFFRSGAMRSMSDPHNGGSSLNDNGWQPRHVSEQFRGSEDNGGVHINSGIPNYAFYLFVQRLRAVRSEEEAKKIAELVYYRALTRYLIRSSNFKDLRAAIERSCSDLYAGTPDVLPSAKAAFDMVGIQGSGTTTPPNRDIAPNPGKEFVVCTDQDRNGVYLSDLNTQPIVLSDRTILSKPSVTDDGTEIYYVGEDKRLYYLQYDDRRRTYTEFELDDNPIYRNVSISKDGRLLAILYGVEENKIHIYDFKDEVYKTYSLYNPTSSGGATQDVRYADQMDFDLSGQYLMYDAFNTLPGSNGTDIEYWDIGFLRVFNKSNGTFGDGKIDKLISSLPENASVGNPVFSKNSPDVLAFDYIESGFFQTSYALLGANLETNTISLIADNRDQLAYPSYSVKDNAILFDSEDNFGNQSLNVIPLASSKISESGSESVLLRGGRWGSWFALGVRKLVHSESLESLSEFSVNPNPFGSEFVLDMKSDVDQEIRLVISDPVGNIVKTEKLVIREGHNKKSIELQTLPAGLYLMTLLNQSGSVTVKIMKK